VNEGNHQLLGAILNASDDLQPTPVEFRFLHGYFKACWHDFQDDYEGAVALCEPLLEAPALDQALRARVLREQGALYMFQGRFDRALISYREAFDIARDLGDTLNQGKAIRNQGIVYHMLADYERALACYEQELDLTRHIADRTEQLKARGQVLNQLGYVNKDMGRWDGSLDAYSQSLLIWSQLGDVFRQGQVFNNLGELYQAVGNFVQAEDCFNRALAIMERPDIGRQSEAVDVHLNFGFLHFVQMNMEAAEQHYTLARDIAHDLESPLLISQVLCRLAELRRHSRDFNQAHALFEAAIRSAEAALTQVNDQEVKIGVLGIRQHIYQAMVLLCLEMGRVDEAFHYAESARSRAFLDMLREAHSSDVANVDLSLASQLDRGTVQALLPEGSALVVFFGTGAAGPGAAMIRRLPPDTQWLREYLAPPDRLIAFVLTSAGLEAVSIPLQQDEIERNFFDARNGRLAGIQPIAGQPLPSTRPWQVLDGQLFTPIRERLAWRSHLFLVPHGVLHYLPMHALNPAGLLPGGNASTSAGDITFSYAPSASVLAHLLSEDVSPRGAERPLTCLTVGVNGPGLSQSETEAHYIASLFSGEALIGSHATFETVLSRAREFDVVHFACHGHFDNVDPMGSCLELYAGERLTARQILREARLSARLITLSACDTGLNRLAYGDELLGLTRAFLGTGADTVLVSLWQVHETPTRLLMESFYEEWKGGATKAIALQHAQTYLRGLAPMDVERELRSSGVAEVEARRQVEVFARMTRSGAHLFDHPYYWAAFLLIGDPR
jgi:CHAT domain-containing protein/tetratricopeptide (TPR) repeat protein